MTTDDNFNAAVLFWEGLRDAKPCSACGGHGVVMVNGVQRECDLCKGTGRDPEPRVGGGGLFTKEAAELAHQLSDCYFDTFGEHSPNCIRLARGMEAFAEKAYKRGKQDGGIY